MGPPSAVPSGDAKMSSELRAAMTCASAAGGLASWNTAIDSDVHGPQMTAPAKKAASPAHSGVCSPSGTIARPQPRTMPVMVGHTGQCRRNGAASSPITAPTPNTAQNVPSSAADPCRSVATCTGSATSIGP